MICIFDHFLVCVDEIILLDLGRGGSPGNNCFNIGTNKLDTKEMHVIAVSCGCVVEQLQCVCTGS